MKTLSSPENYFVVELRLLAHSGAGNRAADSALAVVPASRHKSA